MRLHERPENVNLTYSTKFITKTFLKYSFSVPTETKTIAFIQFFVHFEETPQIRRNCILKLRLHSNVFVTSLGRQF